MFFISLPLSVKIGDTADCRINSAPAKVTYRDAMTLVIEPDDVRTIIHVSDDDELRHFTCGDAEADGGTAGITVISAATVMASDEPLSDERYWIAINGASCAMTALPMRQPLVTPTPKQLLGFPTLNEARKAQQVCLNAPIPEVKRFIQSLHADVMTGRIRVINPKHPQPPTSGQTAWTDSPEVHDVMQGIVKKL